MTCGDQQWRMIADLSLRLLLVWVRRNCRQLMSVWRDGAAGIRCRFRIRRIVEAPTR